jgi:DNA gyrase/topoisomerase IV subunit A
MISKNEETGMSGTRPVSPNDGEVLSISPTSSEEDLIVLESAQVQADIHAEEIAAIQRAHADEIRQLKQLHAIEMRDLRHSFDESLAVEKDAYALSERLERDHNGAEQKNLQQTITELTGQITQLKQQIAELQTALSIAKEEKAQAAKPSFNMLGKYPLLSSSFAMNNLWMARNLGSHILLKPKIDVETQTPSSPRGFNPK